MVMALKKKGFLFKKRVKRFLKNFDELFFFILFLFLILKINGK